MPFRNILRDLVETVPGARGAVFVDPEGEYVELYCIGEADEMKLAGAHQGIVLNTFSSASGELGMGNPRTLYVRNDGIDLFAHTLKDGYFVLLTTDPKGVPGRTLWELSRAARKIEAEI